MTTLALRRVHVPFWPTVGVAVVAWLIAWFVTLPLANWVAYDLLGMQEGSQFGDAIAFFLRVSSPRVRARRTVASGFA